MRRPLQCDHHSVRPLDVSFRARGWGRAVTALFLLLWLAGWAAGEWFVLRAILWAMEGGAGSAAMRALEHPVGWLVGGFALIWITMWTYGGLAALFELGRITVGRDRLTIGSDGWTVRRGVGPFASTKHFLPREVRDVFTRRRGGALMLDTPAGDVLATSFGTAEERAAIVREYSRRDEALNEPPAGWVTERLADGRTRIARAKIESPGCLAFVAFFALACGLYAALFTHAWRWSVTPVAALGALAAALFVWGVISRREWLVRRDEVLLVTRFLQWRRERRIDNGSLHVQRSVDSDGDEWFSFLGTSNGKEVVLLRTLADDRTVLRLARLVEKASGWAVRVDFRPDGAADG